MNNSFLVFIINCDWRDIFRTAIGELEEKFKRDHLGVEKNQFFSLSYSRVGYEAAVNNFRTSHKKTWLDLIRPLLDLRALVEVSFTAWQKKLRPQIWLTYDFGFLPALWLARLFYGGKIVMVLTNQPRIYSRTRRLGAIKAFYSALAERLFHRLPDKYMTINTTMQNYLVSLGVPQNKIVIFSTDTIARDHRFIEQARGGKIRQKLNLAPDAKILLTIGRLEPEKNHERLLELLATLSREYYLVVLGQGRLLSLLQEKAVTLGVAERVFFEGFVDREAIWGYYLDADAFVLLSKAEALGMVFWEAMYLNLPVLGSLAPGILETIGEDGDRGRLWDEAEGERAWREKIRFCVTDSFERTAMVERAKTYVVEKMKNSVTLNDLA